MLRMSRKSRGVHKLMNNIVARFKDGTVCKGKTNDFFHNKRLFHLELVGDDSREVNRNGSKAMEVDREHLKAVYFVKNFQGNKFRKDLYLDDIPGSGRKIQVVFTDGEVLTGYALNYTADRPGFFVVPADVESNNERIFVLKSATEDIKLL